MAESVGTFRPRRPPQRATPGAARPRASVSSSGILGLQRTVGTTVAAIVQRSVEPAGAPGSRPNLDIGDSGPGVTLLQKLLGTRQSGQFDAGTGAAVKKFQQDYQPPSLHPATGGVGPLTWRALDERVQRSGQPQGSPGSRPNLELGDTGEGVSLLQRMLELRPTGIFDAETEQAVIAYQQARPPLLPATGGVGPKTWESLDSGADQQRLEVNGSVVGVGQMSFAEAGTPLEGASELARGAVSLDGVVLAGATPLLAVTGQAVSKIGGAFNAAAKVTDVASTSARAVAIARQAQLQLLRQAAVAAGADASQTPFLAVGLLGRAGVAGIGFAAGVGIALLPVAAAHAAAVAAQLGENGGVSLPGGVPGAPVSDPGDAGTAVLPGSGDGTQADLPGGSGSGPLSAPGTSTQPVALAGVRIPLTPRRAERLEKAERTDTWTDLPGTDRTSLGKAYNHIIETLVREIASGGRARVFHYTNVTPELVSEWRTTGGRVVITEGRLSGGALRFDIAEIDFDSKTVALVDLTALSDPRHAGKTESYRSELARLTGFPVDAYEARYVGDDNTLADEIVVVGAGGR